MTRLGLVIDVGKCNGCYACFMACRDEFCGNEHLPYSAAQPYQGHFWMRVSERDRGAYPKVKTAYIPIMCMHCGAAPCIEQHPDEVYRREDGVVIIDPAKAKGSKGLLDSCPYEAIYWNDEEDLPQKCSLCAHLLDQGWKQPRCVEVCPNGAVVFGDLDDPESAAAKRLAAQKAESLERAWGLDEHVLYLNLPRRFVAGSVVLGDTDRCAAGATVSLKGKGEGRQVKTNAFGDFEFEGLDEYGDYAVEISLPGYRTASVRARTETDTYLGDIVLEKE